MPSRLSKILGGSGVAKAARGTQSDYIIGTPHTWGQPLPMVAASDASGLITPQRMREIVLKTATAAAAMNAVLDYTGGVNLNLRNVDAAKPVPPRQLQKVLAKLKRPNPIQTTRQFMLALIRDMFTLGYAAIEIEPDSAGQPVNLWVMDAARLRVDYDEHGTILGYNMFDARGNPIIKGRDSSNSLYDLPNGPGIGVGSSNPQGKGEHGWEPDEVIFFSLNPMSESVYPYSRITQLFTSAVVEDLMMFFISQRFTDSNIPFGVMDLGDINEQELAIAVNNWNSQAREQHKIMLTGSKAGSKFIPFGYHLKDLEATALLSEVRGKIMAILGVTMNELGESQDIGKSNGYNLSYTFKKRAVEPILNEIVQTLTARLLWDVWGFKDIEFYYDEIDSRDELLQAQIDDVYMKMGVESINDVLNRRGKQSVQGGDDHYVFTGSSWIPVDMIRSMAESLLQAEAAAGGSVSGADSADNMRVKVGSPQPNNAPKKPEGAVHAQRQVSGSKRQT